MIHVNPERKVGWFDKVVKGMAEKLTPRMGVEPVFGEKFVGVRIKRRIL